MFTTKMQAQAQEMRNVHYYSTQDETTSGLQAIVDGISNAYKNNLQGHFSVGFAFYAVDVRKVESAGLPSVEYIPTGSFWLGTNANDVLALQVALLVSFTSLTTKPNKARTYLGGLCENDVTGGLFTTGITANALAWADAMFDPTSSSVTGVAKLTVEWASGGMSELVGSHSPSATRFGVELSAGSGS